MNGLSNAGCTAEGKHVRARLAEKYQLPVSPALFKRLLGLERDGGASLADYAKLVSTSSSLSAKVLSTVNSSWAGVRNSISRVSQAINLLGTASTRTLVLAQCLASAHENVSLPAPVIQQYWQAGLFKATAAKVLAAKHDPDLADRAFLTALLQDTAIPLMHELCPDLYNHTIPRQAKSQAQFCAIEREVFGLDHSWASRAIAEQMQVPPALCTGIADHHDRNALRAACESDALADALYWASLFPHTSRWWRKDDAAAAASLVAERVAEPADAFEETVEQVLSEFWELAELVCPGQDTVRIGDLLRQASGELVDRTTGLVCQVNSMVGTMVEASQEVSHLNAEALQLQDQAFHDGLTGVLNRHGLDTIGAERMAEARRSNESVAMVFVDVDDLKGINDTHGHDYGDKTIKAAAETLMIEFGVAAIVGRYGGDEFVVIACGLESPTHVRSRAAEVQNALRHRPIITPAGEVAVRVSIGGIWCSHTPEDCSMADLIKAADQAMYETKNSQKGETRIVPYSPVSQRGESDQ